MLRAVFFTGLLAAVIFSDEFALAAEAEAEAEAEASYGDRSLDWSQKKYSKEFSNDFQITGGCRFNDLNVIINGMFSCSNGHCRAKCNNGYRFPHGENELAIICRDRNWNVQSGSYDVVPTHCEPICEPNCQNQGICIAPDKCSCAPNYSGPLCQFKEETCLEPPHIKFAHATCSSKMCTISCLNNFVFPDGSSVVNLKCKQGKWEANRNGWTTLPECLPVCNPPCQNGGDCRPLNRCDCPEGFRGPKCEYTAKVCDPKTKLNFNGNYQCIDLDEHSRACSLSCPEAAPFEFTPEARYVCRFASDTFEPQPIPQCKPGPGVRLISGREETSRSFYDHSWMVQGAGYKTIQTQMTVNLSESFGGSIMHEKQQMYGGGGGEQTWTVDNGSESLVVSDTENYNVKVEGGSCFSWAGAHYKNFDGQVYTYDTVCAYTLARETRDELFSVSIQNDPICIGSKTSNHHHCPRVVRIFVEGKEYDLAVNSTSGQRELRNSKGRSMGLSSQLPQLQVREMGNYIVASLETVGLVIKWDGADMVQLEATESLWNRTAGLCGNLNGAREKIGSVSRLFSAWKVENLKEKCEEPPSEQRDWPGELKHEASDFCSKLLDDPRYKDCANLVDFEGFLSSCQWDYCSCPDKDRRKCACKTMEVYVRQCAHKGIVALTGWRDNGVCPMECSNGKMYMARGPRTQATCKAQQITRGSTEIDSDDDFVEEGCFCLPGSVLHEGRCIPPSQCPCLHRNKLLPPGSVIKKECNKCTCAAGSWNCSTSQCGARCSAVGDPHYTTFDGKRYDFMGHCSYYLVKADDYSVEAENSACSIAISEVMGFTRTYQDGEPSCTRSVTIRLKDVAIKLKQNRQILVNGEDVTKLPMSVGKDKDKASIRVISSIFIQVTLPNGLEVLWDGVSRVYVNAPAHLHGKTKGLCGTFTSNQKDDFLTPDGDVEQAVIPFANKWKTLEQCADIKKDTEHPCALNPQKRAAAEKYCSVLKTEGKLFSRCQDDVSPDPFYNDCVYDMCACDSPTLESCLCPSLAAYAKECAAHQIVIPWRNEVQECRLHCPGEQEYQMCGNSCTRSCADISFQPDCKEDCVEGCNCPQGQALDAYGQCIPISQCPCTHGKFEFRPGHKEVRPGAKGQELCTCSGGRWTYTPATPDDIKNYPGIDGYKNTCSATMHQELTTCEPVEPRTCRNMHERVNQSPAICRPGCVCKPGYVLDMPSNKCVKESDCPCYHGGKSYKEGAVMKEECNTCECSAGKWNCTTNVCPGVCTVWGDSHYKTFDGTPFDFQGVCDYVLAKGKLEGVGSFHVSIRNVACGTTGVTCSKSITLVIGNEGSDQEDRVVMTRGKALTVESFRGHGKIAMRRAGLFVFLDVPDLGLVVQWDEGTRAHVRLDSRWRGKTKGLCGNYNDNPLDDLMTPAGGVPTASASLFADSWRMDEQCTGAGDYSRLDTCAKHPERQLWARQKCMVMKSEMFEPCHSEVPPESYIKRCESDACGCDAGGDCECICTAIAAYAHECNARGVHIKWRSQKLCPMQCDETCSSYSPCVTTCPRRTCDNMAVLSNSLHLCDQDTCVEGCEPKPCPPGHIYLNDSYSKCVPETDCRRPVCLIINNVTFYEGDTTKDDGCQKCFCNKGRETCSGTPCVNMPPCKSGYTKWVNLNKPDSYGLEREMMPPISELKIGEFGFCGRQDMVKTECRPANQSSLRHTLDLNVECSVEKGLVCNPIGGMEICPDYEIRAYCRCSGDPPAPVCMPSDRPKVIVEGNCHDYRVCVNNPMGYYWEKMTCGQDLMFNEQKQICDQPINVFAITPECKRDVPPKPCKPDEEWNDCAVRCSKTCESYKHELMQLGFCKGSSDCVPKCVPKNRNQCLNDDYRWKDEVNCVASSICPCKTSEGKLVPPGQMVVEGCKKCQCLNDYYSCDTSDCITTSTPSTTTSTTEWVTPTTMPPTMTPPRACASGDEYWLIESTVNVQIKASSYLTYVTSDSIKLGNMLDSKTWQPTVEDNEPWLEVWFDKAKPIYGIIMKGDAYEDKYVTSYQVTYSFDGYQYSYIADGNKMPKKLHGPIDSKNSMRQDFEPAIEAKVVRIRPITWNNGVAIKIELLGCKDGKTPPPPPKPQPDCMDSMGYDSGFIMDTQVTVSSSYSRIVNLRLSSPTPWRPQLDNPSQYVQFDFVKVRMLTGVETKGGSGTWTTAYKVKYSNDGINWGFVTDERGDVVEFLGNVDDYSSKVNFFDRTIRARYLRIYPTKWHVHIGLRVEIRGCFVPTGPTPPGPTPSPPPPPPSDCNICPGVNSEFISSCPCNGSLYWDGKFCLSRQECPCFVGPTPYPVGSMYETPDCQQCHCEMGGVPVNCKPKDCNCDSQMYRPVLNKLCSCECKPCPIGQRLCPTSKICIDEAKWCDGMVDCMDDEINCGTTSTTTTTTTMPTPIVPKPCECPPGYLMKIIETINVTYTYTWTFTMVKETTIKKEIQSSVPPPIFDRFADESVEEKEVCPNYVCVPPPGPPDVCSIKQCPEGFKLKHNQNKKESKTSCTCEPKPPKYRVCDVVAKTFITFDGYKYQYDFCKHILARSRRSYSWAVIVEKDCDKKFICSNQLVILMDSYRVVLYPDMHVKINGIPYDQSAVKLLNDKHPGLKLSRIGDTLRLESINHKFWAMIDTDGNIKIGASELLFGEVDGMCGYMDGSKMNDLTMPNNMETSSSVTFGDSWKTTDSAVCMTQQECPEEYQKEAWKICNLINEETFDACENKLLKRDEFLSPCIENSCACLRAGNVTSQECRCRALTSFVSKCLATSDDRNLDLSAWRGIYDCPADCKAPFVHKDCYRRSCERSCSNLRYSQDPCPVLDNLCVPGCYCPDGLVRSGDTCVPPVKCRDCVCEGFGNTMIVNFDSHNLDYNGNCTYLLSKDNTSKSKKPLYEVYVTNAPCKEGSCTQSITVLYQSHVVQISKTDLPHQLSCTVDDQKVSKYPLSNQWLQLKESPNGDYKMLIPEIQLELVCQKFNFAYALSVPSITFGGAMLGLCGNCNNDPRDDFRLPNGQLTINFTQFIESWQLKEPLPGLGSVSTHCMSEPPKRCEDMPPTPDGTCEKLLLEGGLFGRCHALVSPQPYFQACRNSLCKQESVCANFEAYARSCAAAGVCVDWRTNACPMQCSPGKEYHACKPGCQDTCDSIKSGAPCKVAPIEGCFCPPNQILRNGTCVPKLTCFPCDNEGHYEGNVWKPDKCTTCSCTNGLKSCSKEKCSSLLGRTCQKNHKSEVVKGTEDSCCPEYVCVPTDVPQECSKDEPLPVCANDQTLKYVVVDQCPKYICECVPKEQCPPDIDVRILEPGYVEEYDMKGCCPTRKLICDEKTCPEPKRCPKYYIPIEKPGCCRTIECEPPKDICLVELEPSNELDFQDIIPKKIGESWREGKCKSCTCKLNKGKPEAECVVQRCPRISEHPDFSDYELKEVPSDDCCPAVIRTACKEYNMIYQVGEPWNPNPKDKCSKSKCIRDELGRVTKSTEVQSCKTTCDPGYTYQSPTIQTGRCCGECVPTGCVVDGKVKMIGDTWYSEDNCIKNSCWVMDGSIRIHVESETCKNDTYLDHNDYKYELRKVDGKCCPEIVRVGCFDHGKFHEPGDSWASEYDPCSYMDCLIEDGQIKKTNYTNLCTNTCEKGQQYQEPKPGKCCGQCKQIYCVDEDGIIRKPDDIWYSNNNCTTHSCIQKNDQFILSTSSPECPKLNCDKQYIIDDGCCKRCQVPPHDLDCGTSVAPMNETIGIIVETIGYIKCKNLKPIEGLTQCAGNCKSKTDFKPGAHEQDTSCQCCKPLGTFTQKLLDVELDCEDGTKINKKISFPIPTECSCQGCSPKLKF